VISFSAFLMGILLAYGHVFLFAVLLSAGAQGLSTFTRLFMTPFISAYQVAILFFFTVLPYTVATIIPSWRAATTDPDLVMRT
jgi:ABC-type lipoprotein release transport system permease subunit